MKEWNIHKTIFEADQINPGLAVSPWSGHRQFAYDLIGFLQPQKIVELGTHYGCSLFSFLQACKDLNLNTGISAVDSWEGDKQAGFYGEEVIETVKRTVKEFFPDQNVTLIRKYFNEAAKEVSDNSIDILHIDGLHTYDAVSEDFRTWLPKLKENGIVLFHDIASKLKYGTNDFWEELKQKYSSYYTFEHSWGLGVLFPKGDRVFKMLEDNNMRDKMLIYEYYAENLLLNIQLLDHQKMVCERDQAMASMTEMINERDKTIASMTDMIDERDQAERSMTEMINERDKTIASMTNMINERDKAEQVMTEMIDERDKAEQTMTEMINERDKTIASMTEMINERDKSIASMTNMIDDKDKAIESMTAMIDERDACISSMTDMIDERDRYIAELTADLEK